MFPQVWMETEAYPIAEPVPPRIHPDVRVALPPDPRTASFRVANLPPRLLLGHGETLQEGRANLRSPSTTGRAVPKTSFQKRRGLLAMEMVMMMSRRYFQKKRKEDRRN